MISILTLLHYYQTLGNDPLVTRKLASGVKWPIRFYWNQLYYPILQDYLSIAIYLTQPWSLHNSYLFPLSIYTPYAFSLHYY
jgi:hypothetical protein